MAHGYSSPAAHARTVALVKASLRTNPPKAVKVSVHPSDLRNCARRIVR